MTLIAELIKPQTKKWALYYDLRQNTLKCSWGI